ncbi:small, acid-soluble spore protein, alpha/beta type [Fulvimonas yonginensis]|uniref:Small, acid-soluble spore protein, alpha/beta type n=1 Tax=Fulvimonas yonginensis TaxID=1495200 RepID=A0ABU8JFM1_9GAMM
MKNQDNERSNQQQTGGRSSHEDNGDMTVREAGHKGGQRVRELIEEGKESEGDRGGNER